jgi:hypothetical protein
MDSFVFARHTPDCKFKRDRLYRRCNCPKWVEGRFNRERIRKSAATRLWDEAEQFRLKLEQALTQGLPLSSLNADSVTAETSATALSSPSVLSPPTPPAPPIIESVANVILPVFALTQLAAMAMHMGGVVSEIYPGSTWIRKFIAAIGALMVSGIVRFAESMVNRRCFTFLSRCRIRIYKLPLVQFLVLNC